MRRAAERTGAGLAGVVTILVAIAMSLAPRSAEAQLVSPGKLAAAHAQLEGMTNCTQCHVLGTRGASDAKCLGCHENLRARIQAKKGLHATFTGKSCGSCHKDHFGTDFQLIRFDTVGFDHKKVGFELRLGHRKPKCQECHRASLIANAEVRRYATAHRTLDRTYLGLATGCVDCHRTDNVHADQFGTRTCTACHDEATWKKAPLFDHDSTRYVLTGRHRVADCDKCHKPMRVPGVTDPVTKYVGVKSAPCTSCHEDHHKGAMQQACETCHSTDGWARLRNRSAFESGFDHNARTQFALRGAHADVPCATCHSPSPQGTAAIRITLRPNQGRAMYPAPVSSGCLSCHLDAHENTFARTAGGPTCQNCHNETSWLPAAYDLARHNRETFVLTGAHLAVECASCHKPVRAFGPPQFRIEGKECESCHRTRDPHAGQFTGRPCASCHNTDAFRIQGFDHSKTRYPLDGAHRDVPCAKCHVVTTASGGASYVKYRPLETTCRACHGAAIPRRP